MCILSCLIPFILIGYYQKIIALIILGVGSDPAPKEVL